ncbi:hypothetical protein BKA67DRAFT_72329 [Truncatella angustata]|uniref:Uncharacterized protein n=1 Tax=Truncatella angustata TaxID=152316 RepID=A0A9P8UYQ0_9PEZI|nr:uncharacterized protein BKA67DRAFT_72329 [Truncatella angustata]KAH6661001.1 hypothetical protein BKA67DRAFT_72329 [Truncatella angustata]
MALARSASGPGGLSINTSSANNLFGAPSTSAAPAGGGLFANASQPQTTQPATASGLFGTASNTTPAPSTGGLFGSTAATATTQPAQPPGASSGGLFGSNTAQTQPTMGSALFGGQTNSTNQAAQPAPGGGLFGNTSTTNQPGQQPATGQGLFGNANTNNAQPQQQQQQQQTGGLFGNTQPTQGSSLFASSLLGGGNQQQQQQQQPTGLGASLGQSTNQQTVPGVRIDLSNVRGTTRFNDLQEDLQKKIIWIDDQIQSYMNQKNELDAFMPGHGEMLSHVPNDVKFVQMKYDGVQSALRSDAEAIESVQNLHAQDVEHAKLSFRAIDNLKLPQQYHNTGLWSSRSQTGSSANTESDGQDLVSFFSKTSDEMDEQLKRYEKNLTEIEMHMHGIQGSLIEQLQRMMATKNGGPSPADEKLADLAAVLRDFEQGILQVATSVGGAREGMTRLQLGEFIQNDHSRSGVY